MPLAVTLHVYSGRPNPSWVLSPEQSVELLAILRSLRTQTPFKARSIAKRLGYRGFSVASTPRSSFGDIWFYVNRGVVDLGPTEVSLLDSQHEVEGRLLDSAKPYTSETVRGWIGQAMDIPVTEMAIHGNLMAAEAATRACARKAFDAPLYEPAKWSVSTVQFTNNCYNYANNRPDGNLAQPGHAHGIEIRSSSCDEVQNAALADGLSLVKDTNTPRARGEGWYVALALAPGEDYHWYRQDADGCWSHKIDKLEVIDTDESGALIINPEACDRGVYTKFCHYMVTGNGVIIS